MCILSLVIQHVNRVFSASYDTAIRALASSTIYHHTHINGTIFGKSYGTKNVF